MKQKITICCLALLFSMLVVTISLAKQLSVAKKQQFIQFLLPKIKIAQQHVLAERRRLQADYIAWQEQAPLSLKQREWLELVAASYGVKRANFQINKTWQLLLRRVDILPTSLILAQAITESGWGRSRFAKVANNYFGVWCTRPGCGVVPRARAKGATHEVRKYDSIKASILGYLHNINTQRSYHQLRLTRAAMRSDRGNLNSMILIKGLRRYSQLGYRYVSILHAVINHYQLLQYDNK